MTKVITTNIFDTLFIQDATKQNKKVKSNYLEIWKQVEIYMHCKNESENVTQFKELLANTSWRFLFIDEKGKLKTGKNNKLVYGTATKKNMSNQVSKLSGLKNEFFAWATNGEKSDVTSLSGTISAITPKTNADKAPEKISGDGENDAEELAQTQEKSKRTFDEFVTWVYMQAHKEFNMSPEKFLENLDSPLGAKGFDKAIEKIAL